MISQRLRGVREDGEAIEEEGFMPKLKKAFGDVGIEIEDQNGELRSTYDILNDLAGVWDQLSSKQRQYLGEKAAGNRQVKTLNAIMGNWDVVQDTIQKANEATGEATKGNEKYLDSIEGRITQFKSAFSDLARTTIDSDLVKGIVGFGTGVLNVTKDLGGLVPVLTTISGIIIALKGAKIAEGIGRIGTAITNMVSGVNMLSSGLSVVGIAITAIMGAVAIGKALNKGMQDIGLAAKSFETLKEASYKARQNYSEQENALNSLNTELENTRSLMSDLESKGKLTIVEQEQYDELKKTNEELERQIKLQRIKTDIAKRESRDATAEAFGGKENQTVKETIDFGENAIYDSTKIMARLGIDELQKLTTKVNKDLDAMNAQIIAPESTYKEAVISAFNTITYFKENLDGAQLELNKMIDSSDNLESLMSTNEYRTAEALRDYWQQEYDMRSRVLLQYQNDIEDIYGGDLTKISKPITAREKAYNQRIDEYTMIDDLFLQMEDASISKIFDYVQGKFKEEFKNIHKLISENGLITLEDLTGNVNYSGVIAELEKYGVTIEETVGYLNSLYELQSQVSTDQFSSIEDLITNNYLATDSYKTLSAAMTEQQKAGTISMETYQKLIESDKELANALTLTANGYALNSDAVNKYVQTKIDEQKVQALLAYDEEVQKLEELKNRYEELSNATIKTDEIRSELAQNQDAQDAAEKEMEAIAAYVRELDAATGALARYKAAKSSANEDANYQESKNVFKTIQEGNKTGKRNIDDYQSAINYVLGDNWKENLKEFGGSVDKAYKEAEKKSKRYSGQKDEKTGLKNFMKDVGATDFGTYDSKTGKLTLNKGVTLDQLATELNMSKDYIADLFKAINTYAGEGEGFTFPELFTDDDKKQAEARKKALEENEKSQEQMGDKIADVNAKIEEANKNGDEKEIQRLEQQRKRYEDAQKVLEQQHTDIESGVETNIDTMSLDDAKKKIDELYQVINTLNGEGINVPVEIGELYDKLLNTFPQLRDDLNQPIAPIAVDINDGATEPLEETKKTLDELNGSVADTTVNTDTGNSIPDMEVVHDELIELDGKDAEASLNVNDNGSSEKLSSVENTISNIEGDKDTTLNVEAQGVGEAESAIQAVEDGPYDAKINTFAENVDTAKGEISNAANNPYNAYIDVSPKNLETTDGAIDNVANKKRTATVQVKYNIGGIDVEPDQIDDYGMLDAAKLTPEQVKQWQDTNGKTSSIIPFGGISSEEAKASGISARIAADEQSGKDIVQQVQEQVDKQDPIEMPEPGKQDDGFDWIDKWNEKIGQDENATIDVTTETSNPEEPINQVQQAADSNPIEFTWGDVTKASNAADELINRAEAGGVGNYTEGQTAIDNLRSAYQNLEVAMNKAKNVELGDLGGAMEASTNLQAAASEFATAYKNLSSINEVLSIDPIEVDADTTAALQKVQAIGENGATINVSADTTSASNSIDALGNKTVTVTVQAQTTGFAKGTKNAPNGLSLVDEKGAELIEHTRQGTYELGTNNGPRITNLEAGDVVHTASETKRILARVAKIGGFFRDGLNQAKSVITGKSFGSGVDGSSSLGGDLSSKKKSSKKKSSKKSSKKTGKSSKTNMKKLQTWYEKLFDWAEVRLDRLQRITNDWINKAAEAVGYAAKNTQLNSAIKSVQNQIKDTTAAYNLYINETDTIAKKMKLSADIVEKIKNGTIQIASYDKKTQQKIQYVQEYYEKALNAKDALQELREQEKELALQKLDNITSHFDARTNYYESQIRRRSGDLELAEAQGREQRASDYNTSIDLTNKKLNNLVQERSALNTEFSKLVSQGYIKKDSEEWYEYQSKIVDLDNEILTVKKDIIDLHDAANQVNLTKLGYQLDALTNAASHVDEMISLHNAQAIDEYAENYKKLIDNGMEQIKNLQAQNAEYRKQQQGLDKMSAKYQELEQSIQSNISAINQMKVSQEGWNDSVYDIQIGKIEDFKEQLEKTNDLYERQKNLQDAIRELEKVQGQRTQRVYRGGGVGFTYEADQEALRDAQESLEDVIQDELMSKMDDLIDALEEQKENSNIYDANGNLLGSKYVIPQLDNLSNILSNYYNNPNTAPSVDAIRKLFMDELVSSNTTSSQNQVSMSIGDIIVNEANNGNDLANAIINQLPNALLQAMYKK